MIKGLGIDIVSIKRIEKMLIRWEDKFSNRVFTKNEISYCQSKHYRASHFAARFAAKEATYKVLGNHLEILRWREIEVANQESGKPFLRLYGKTSSVARNTGIDILHISLSHSKEYAVAQVVGEGKEKNDTFISGGNEKS